MFENIIKQAVKNGLTAKEYNLQSGYYYDGKDNGYTYPCITFFSNSETGKELSNWLDVVLKIAKRYKLVKIDSSLYHDCAFMRYTTKECSEKATEAYGKSVCFQEGFFMARYNNKNAKTEDLIKAGHAALIAHGYEV